MRLDAQTERFECATGWWGTRGCLGFVVEVGRLEGTQTRSTVRIMSRAVCLLVLNVPEDGLTIDEGDCTRDDRVADLTHHKTIRRVVEA